jgi:hypothetical protein
MEGHDKKLRTSKANFRSGSFKAFKLIFPENFCKAFSMENISLKAELSNASIKASKN